MKMYKKIVIILLIVFSSSALFVSKTDAQVFGPVFVGVDVSVEKKTIWEKIGDVFKTIQSTIGSQISDRTLGMFLDSLAYDVATELAEGGPGGEPQFRTISIGKSLDNSGKKAVGTFLGELTEKGFDELGINLCDPSIELKLTLTLGIIDKEAPPRPSRGCSWNNLKKNWQDFGDNVQADIIKFQLNPQRSGVTSTLDFFKGITSPKSSELGIALELDAELNRRKIEAIEILKIDAEECKGYKDNKTPISEEVITHCSINEGMAKSMFVNATKIEADKQLAKKEAATNKSFTDILKDAGNKFVNTFSSKLMNNWIKKGMWSLFGRAENDIYEDYRNDLLDKLRGGGNLRQPRGADIFKELKTVSIESLESFDYINDFTICPSQFRKPDNCVMSPAFLQALNDKVTIGQAIERGFISGDIPFIHPGDAINHTVNKCYRDGLCHSNLVKLRKANIIPVGWELAALRAPVSLQQAIDCFEDTEDGGACNFSVDTTPGNPYMVDGNFHNPFYHLVDPDWVMKTPSVRCDAYAFSSILESSETSNRQQYCADPKICLQEDSDGNCLDGQFSYCTRSENIWDFKGESCAAGEIYSGCLSFSNKDFGKASYIEDTLDYCDSSQAGCRRYSQEKDNVGNWVLEDIDDDVNDLFLNNQAAECSADNAGCNEYIVLAPGTGANIIPNGSFDDLDDDGFPDGWFRGNTSNIESDGIDDPDGLVAVPGIPLDYDGDRVPNGYSYGAGGVDTTERVTIRVELQPNMVYKLSAAASQIGPSRVDQARIAVTMCDDFDDCSDDSPAKAVANLGDCELGYGNHYNNATLLIRPAGTELERGACSFKTNEKVSYAYVNVGANSQAWVNWFDDVKVEVIGDPNNIDSSVYSDYGDGARIYTGNGTIMCTADEVGCQGYIPNNNDPMIPAVITQNDLCPSECVAYDTFTEQPDQFDVIEGDLDVEYYNFIPETASQCPAQEIGCEEFTNLDVIAQGGEGKEYFTYLRQCVVEDLGDFYYTWEGTEVAGYQIKTWYALPDNSGEAPCTNMAPEGVNCLDVEFDDDGTDVLNEAAACGPDTDDPADDPENDPNCREFFDANGAIYYRLQDRVIFATNNCHDYRRTETGQIYKVVPEESIQCAASNNGCKAYYGNNANNVREVFLDNFEQGTYEPWTAIDGSPLDLSNVALQNNGHSLVATVNEGFSRDILNDPLKVGKTYKISWWMMSSVFLEQAGMDMYITDGGDTIISSVLNPDDDSNFQNIEPNKWHQYSISTTILPFGNNIDENSLDAMFLRLNMSGIDQVVYIDNFTIKEVENSFSVVRNSWVTPIACDSPYEGYHLGCQAYRDLNNREFNLRSFDYLCREVAIGCVPVIDTNNSTNPFEENFRPSYCSDPDFTTRVTCEAVPGEIWIEEYAEITVEADSINYLVPDVNNYCPQGEKGCTELGLPDRLDETSFSTTYKLNDPDKYSAILCSSEGLNCAAYDSSKGTYYFKDPGLDTCTYQQNALIENNLLSGWFKTSSLGDTVPLGCADTDGNSDSNADGSYDVGELILPSDYCSVSETDPIPVSFFTREDCETNGYWNEYFKAAQCPANENLCTSFRDPVDPLNCDPKGRNIDFIDYRGFCFDGAINSGESTQLDCENNSNTWVLPSRDGYCDSNIYNNEKDCEDAGHNWTAYCENYYYYDNKNIDETSCNGLVDRQNGCVLFYNANDWDAEHNQILTIYDADETYEDIEASNRPSSPVACDPAFDPSCNLTANKLIKVTKDRQCAEWLACKSSTAVKDESGEYKIICDDIDSCIEFQYDPDSNTTKCKKWGSYDEEVEALTFEKYQSRDTGLRNHISWSDKEYTGYSIPDTLPINKLLVYDFGEGNSRLSYNVIDEADADGMYYSGCVDGDNNNLDGQACTAIINTDGDYNFRGECQQGVCWVNPKANTLSTTTYAIETRAYAIVDAPFPAAIEPNPENSNRLSKYAQANICSNDGSNPNACEESFKRVSFGRGQEVHYYPIEPILGNEIPLGICTSGELLEDRAKGTPKTCNKNWDCNSKDSDGNSNSDGFCSFKTEEISFRNWPGICLEYDFNAPITKDGELSYYCNQWYPAQKIKGTSSLYNNYQEAGYFEPNGKDVLFCAVAEPFELPTDRIYCGASGNVGCRLLFRVPAGAKISLSALDDFDWILDYGYLKEDAFTHVAAAIANDSSAFPNEPIDGTPAKTSFERIEKAGLYNMPGQNQVGLDISQFNLYDFELPNDVEINNLSQILIEADEIFQVYDADIEYFYLDENVANTGAYRNSSKVWDEMLGFAPHWGPECDLNTQPSGWECSDGTVGLIGGGHDIRYAAGGEILEEGNEQIPADRYHNVNSKSNGGVYDCSGSCGWGKSKVCRDVYCNPLNYNYYVKAELNTSLQPNEPLICDDYNCTDGSNPNMDIGLQCLTVADSIFESILTTTANWSWTVPVVDMLYDTQCGGDPNCEFVYCVNMLGNPAGDHDAVTDITNVIQDNIVFCSDFGKVEVQDIEFYVEDDPEIKVAKHTTDINGCMTRLFETESRSIATDFGQPSSSLEYSTPDFYNALITKEGVSNALMIQVFGDYYNNDNEALGNIGCLPNPNSNIPKDIDCRAAEGVLDYMTGGGWSGPDANYLYFNTTVIGNPCDGPDGDQPLNCYQQCRIVTHLDSSGDLSAVRTDIWWRNKTDNQRVTVPHWESWYSDISNIYTRHNDVLYANIESLPDPIPGENYPENFAPFGAALGIFDADKLISTKVPFYNNRTTSLTAATFFSNFDSSITLETATDNALLEIQNLFYRVYNLEWTDGTCTGSATCEPLDQTSCDADVACTWEIYDNHRYDLYEERGLGGGNHRNPYAGPDYSPRVLATCGEDLCETLDLDGNVLAVKEGMTINGFSEGSLLGQNSSLFVNVKFFYHAHPDHMPIYSIAMDWGDGPINNFALNPGKYKNSLPRYYCNPDVDAPGDANPSTPGEPREPQQMGFAGEEGACQAGYKVFYHDYLYDEARRHDCIGILGADGTPRQPIIPNASCYQPRVRIIDNWGWGQNSAVPFNGWIVVYAE